MKNYGNNHHFSGYRCNSGHCGITSIQNGQTRYELVDNAGHDEIRKISGFDDKHIISFEFSQPIPDLPGLKDGIALNGRCEYYMSASFNHGQL